MTGRILFCGDPHGRFGQINAAAVRHRPDALVLLGDHELERPLEAELRVALEHAPVWWIPGNHDFGGEGYHDHLFGSALADYSLHGRVVELGGLRVAGLGGHFQ